MNHYQLKKLPGPDFTHVVLGRTIFKQRNKMYPYKSIIHPNQSHLKLKDLRELITSQKYQNYQYLTPMKKKFKKTYQQNYVSEPAKRKSIGSVFKIDLSTTGKSKNQRLKNILLKKTLQPPKVLNIQFQVRAKRQRSTLSLKINKSQPYQKSKITENLKQEIRLKKYQHRRCYTDSIQIQRPIGQFFIGKYQKEEKI